MWHPSPEELARLIDEPPTAAEAEHLVACTECAAELDAMRAEHAALAALPRILPVPTSWETMRHRLERDGLLSGSRRAGWTPGIAAALALFLAGAATGVAFADGWNVGDREVAAASDPIEAPTRVTPPAAADLARIEPVRSDEPDAQPTVDSLEPRPSKLASRNATERPGADVRQAAEDDDLPSLYGTPANAPDWDAIAARASRARTPDEAARYMRDAEGAYVAAMTRLAELTSAQSTDPAVRLATLDGIVVTTGAALERAPADPVINGYHLAARAQRDALLRTVSSSREQDPWY
ncbi:MAG TPA: hypothetical protein VMN78_01960 [Longimicrobiales bacterium]|nr:hypothetical protein [Longimicrobiales bacterium]